MSRSKSIRGRYRGVVFLGVGYVVSLLVSHVVAGGSDDRPATDLRFLEVDAVDGDARRQTPVRLAWRQWGDWATDAAVPVIMLHGSPGSHRDFRNLAPLMESERGLVAPDLPGFGASTRDVPDYSVRAHARYVLDVLDHLGIDRAHVLGFSMGGGVALELSGIAPERVASLTLVSSIGVQEMELLGSYSLNHLIHGLQLAALWTLQEAVPHMGLLSGFMLNVPYARNFYDTDQRPLRGLLSRLEMPALIVHGRDDFLVPREAAIEHHRLMPHSELQMLADTHFFLFRPRADLADLLEDFFDRVDSGQARSRSRAEPQRIVAAARPFNSRDAPRWMGPALLSVLLLLAFATFVSEDLTCIGAGLLIAQGRLALMPGILACFIGIFVGDLLLYAAGRYIGRPVLRVPPLRWWVSRESVEASAAWFERRGALVIGLGRFVPGTRLPTYLAAGILRVPFLRCSFYFLVAAAIWTPLLVGGAVLTGATALDRIEGFQERGLLLLLVLVAGLWTIRGVVLPVLTWRGRRRLVGIWRRWTRWEFWPSWLVYPPLLVYLLFLGMKYRGLTVFTAANPAMPAGGFLGESKADILAGLAGTGSAVPVWRRLVDGPAVDRTADLRSFMRAEKLDYPLILKPDVGQRGSDVALVRSDSEAMEHLGKHPEPFLAQAFVDGPEFSVFYYRFPSQDHGRIFSITEKQPAVVVGDGRRTLENLILADPRAVVLSSVYLREMGSRCFEIPDAGEVVALSEIGAHARGTIFLDGWRLYTEALEAKVDELSRTYEGFYFGRYDFRAPSVEAFQQGRELRILELNGVSSDSTDIYDAKNSYFAALRKLRRQWRLAFEIGRECRAAGFETYGVLSLLRLVIRNRRYLP